MKRRCALAALLCAALPGCERPPAFVHVLEAPQSVELSASASAIRVRVGEPVVLSAQRATQGTWKRIPSGELKPEQCWMATPPPAREAEVADNMHWVVDPQGAATFNIDFRADHTRSVTFSKEGVFTFTPSTSVWCEPGRGVTAPPIRIEVVAQ